MKLETTKTTTFYRNLNGTNGNKWSIKSPGHNEGRVMHSKAITAGSVTIKHGSGKAFEKCLEGGHRAVFAWFKTKDALWTECSDIVKGHIESGEDMQGRKIERVRFNPTKGDRYFNIGGERVDHLSRVFCLENGDCYGIR